MDNSGDGEPASSTAATWQDVTLRALLHYEFSAVGVAADAGGAFLAEVPANSAAFAAGLRRGDFIQGVNGIAVHKVKEFLEAVKLVPAGQKVKLSLVRNQQAMTLELHVVSR